MRARKWSPFVGDGASFEYPGEALRKHWPRLHCGDREPYPTAQSLAERLEAAGVTGRDAVARVQDAWRAFHRGDFHEAYELGTALGLAGFAPAIKAAGVYASYLEKNAQRAQALLLEVSELAERAASRLPADPNAHYLLAFALGRYSQRTSILDALARGLAGKIENALERTLKLEPKHADAHIALGLYHAEIVAKLGSLAGGLTYGASARKAVDHFKKALKLNPHAPTPRLEYAYGLKLLDRDRHAAQIEELLGQAAECEPVDAMEWLDRRRARELLE